MIILQIILPIIFLIIIPIVLGSYIVPSDDDNFIIKSFLMGLFSMFALLEIICVPLTLLHINYHVLLNVYTTLLLFISAISGVSFVKDKLFRITIKKKTIRLNYLEIIGIVVIVAAFCFSMYNATATWGYLGAGDDASYVANSLSMIYYDKLNTGFELGDSDQIQIKYAITSIMPFFSIGSQLTLTEPAIFAHTHIPIVMQCASFCIIYLYSDFFSKDREIKILLFAAICAIQVFFSGAYAMPTALLGGIASGKAIFYGIIGPMIVLMNSQLIGEGFDKRLGIELFVTSCAACSMTFIGTISAIAVAISFFMIGIILNQRQNIKYVMIELAWPTTMMALFLAWGKL